MMTRLRLLPSVLILGLGFAGGAAWTSLGAVQRAADDSRRPRVVDARGPLTAVERDLTELFEESSPSVVNVTSLALQRDFFRLNVMEIPRGAGSGIVWDRLGHVVTNFHVVRGANGWEVTLADQTVRRAELVGTAPEKDLAVLRIEADPDELVPIRIGSSADLRVGQTVLAIGNPFGFDQSLTTGIISALGREIESVARVPISDVIQTDAAINPGNSGGPLLDSAGRLIGVNTAIYSPSGSSAGIGFAIPVDTVNWVVPDLIAYGRIRRPTLGVELAPPHINRRLGLEGILVMNVVERSGAEIAGFRPTRRDARGRWMLGDIIVAVDGEPVRSSSELGLRLEPFEPGEEVTVTVDRDGRRLDLDVVLGAPG
jgi:S1-C subfamily serine protease